MEEEHRNVGISERGRGLWRDRVWPVLTAGLLLPVPRQEPELRGHGVRGRIACSCLEGHDIEAASFASKSAFLTFHYLFPS